jgi:hypothetical protein
VEFQIKGPKNRSFVAVVADAKPATA